MEYKYDTRLLIENMDKHADFMDKFKTEDNICDF